MDGRSSRSKLPAAFPRFDEVTDLAASERRDIVQRPWQPQRRGDQGRGAPVICAQQPHDPLPRPKLHVRRKLQAEAVSPHSQVVLPPKPQQSTEAFQDPDTIDVMHSVRELVGFSATSVGLPPGLVDLKTCALSPTGSTIADRRESVRIIHGLIARVSRR